MRCTVCGRQTKFHKVAKWALQQRVDGKWVTQQTAEASKCSVIRFWQSALIFGGTMRIHRLPSVKVEVQGA